MKKVKTLIGKFSPAKGLITLAMMAVVFYSAAFTSFAASGKVTADTAKIRAEANTDSEVVGSTVQGKTIDILDAVKDSSGMVWYKVSVAGGGYGYIRSDLVETSDQIEVSSTAAPSSQEQPETEQPPETVPTSIGEQQATIQSTGSVRIRSGASTAHEAVTSLPNGTVITLIGEANDSAGNKWYQMTCDYNGRKVEGYVRSDLIVIGAPQPEEAPGEEAGEGESTEGEETEGEAAGEGESEGEGEGQEPAEEPIEEPVEEHNDYEVVYGEDPNTGENIYWLNDNVNQERQRLSELLGVASAANERIEKLQDQVDKEKIVIIILAVVIVVLFIIITVLLFKVRSLYYEDYDEEEEEEEEEEEPVPVKKKVKKRIVEEEEAPVPVKKKKPAVKGETELRAAERKDPAARKEPAARENAKEPTKKPVQRKAQNFLIDDDEFEFEFLNMDDKDL